MSIFSISLDAIYVGPIGTDATMSAFADPVRAVDKTAGIVVEPIAKGSTVATVIPAAMLRVSEMRANGVTNPVDLVGTTITLNGVTWNIVNYSFAPQPGGEAEGEVRLHLRKTGV